MRLEFEELVIKDFKAFKGEHRLPLNVPGVTYLFGENFVTKNLFGNGAAKSTIWDALMWCLFGRTPRGLRNPDVKPWSGGKTSVGVVASIDGKRTEFVRTISPNRFTCDGEDIPDFQSVYGIGFELATNTILLPQGRDLFLERSPSEKMVLFSDALDLKRWDARSSEASKRTLAFETTVTELESEKWTVLGALDELRVSIEATKKLSQEWVDKSRSRSRASQKEVEVLQKKRTSLDTRLSGAILAEDSALTELRAAEDSLRKMRAAQSRLIGEISSLDARIEILSDRLTTLEAELKGLEGAKICPTCGQSVKNNQLTQHKADIDQSCNEVDVELTNAAGEREQLVIKKLAADKLIEAADTAANSFDEKARSATDTVLRLRPEIAELDLKIKSMTAPLEDNPYTDQIASLNKRQHNVTREVNEIEAELDRTRADSEHARFWIKGFKDIKLQLIDDVLSELELVANSMIEEVGLDGWQINFDIEREAKSGNITNQINVEVISPESKKPVRWEAYSGGECQRLRLIGSLALADVLLGHAGIETNLEILDEPAVYWSSEGVQELVEFLAYRAREREKSIFFIEHSAVESSHFARVWTVRKGKGGAEVLGVDNGGPERRPNEAARDLSKARQLQDGVRKPKRDK